MLRTASSRKRGKRSFNCRGKFFLQESRLQTGLTGCAGFVLSFEFLRETEKTKPESHVQAFDPVDHVNLVRSFYVVCVCLRESAVPTWRAIALCEGGSACPELSRRAANTQSLRTLRLCGEIRSFGWEGTNVRMSWMSPSCSFASVEKAATSRRKHLYQPS